MPIGLLSHNTFPISYNQVPFDELKIPFFSPPISITFPSMPEQKDQKHGLVVIHTGDGKGKTTAALGIAVRAAGYKMKVLILQFVKGSWKYGEMNGVKMLAPYVEMKQLGKGFVGIIDDKLPFEEHVKKAEEALAEAKEWILKNEHRIIILDEINVALGLRLLKVEDVLNLIKSKPPEMHLVLTGRNAPPELIEAADMVTEMKEIKHPFRKGILAQRGIDF